MVKIIKVNHQVIGDFNQFLVIKKWAPMPGVLYEVPDHYKNAVVGCYIFGWLFVGKVFNF